MDPKLPTKALPPIQCVQGQRKPQLTKLGHREETTPEQSIGAPHLLGTCGQL